MAKDNKTLGMFRLDGIPAAPRGLPQIEVTFDIDANGILDVTAKDKATGKEQKIQITASTNLSESEVENMVNAAKQHEAEDSKLRDLIQARNQADQMIYATEKSLNELGDKVAEGEKSQIEGMIAELKTAVTTEDTTQIKTLTEQLQQASHALSQQLYQSQAEPGSQAQPGSNGSGNGQESPDDVVEGEFQEM
jgi:molecular chaperone DnaK